ncbi:MAG: hypothetical protein RID81_07195 [Sandaracinaceae bacterium]
MTKAYASEIVDALLDFGSVLSSKLGSSTRSLVGKLRGDETGEDEHEDVEDCEIWGHAAILWRPAAPSSDGECEAVVWRRGDELVAVATKERRWQVDLEAGEVVIRAFGAGAASLRLKPDGSAILEATDIRLGSEAVTNFLARADHVDANLDTILNAFNMHTHSTPSGASGAPLVTAGPLVGTASDYTRSD